MRISLVKIFDVCKLLIFLLVKKNNHSFIGAFSQIIANFAYPLGRNPAEQKAFSLVLCLKIANFRLSKSNAENAPFVVFVYGWCKIPALLSYTITARGDYFSSVLSIGVFGDTRDKRAWAKSSSAPFVFINH